MLIYYGKENLLFLGHSEKLIDDYYNNHIFAMVEKYGLNIPLNERVSDNNITDFDTYLDTYVFKQEYIDEGMFILTSINDISLINKIIAKRNNNQNIEIILMTGSITQKEIKDSLTLDDYSIYYMTNYWPGVAPNSVDDYYKDNYATSTDASITDVKPEIAVISYVIYIYIYLLLLLFV